MSNEAEITPKRKSKKTPRSHLLVEIEQGEDGSITAIKGILPMPPLPKGGDPVPKRVRAGCSNVAKTGDRTYDGKTMLVLHYTSNPFRMVSETMISAKDCQIKNKPGSTDKG